MVTTTPRVFLDVEEALSREVRRITFHDHRTLDKTVLKDTFDPFSGEVIKAPIEAKFYDSSADANHIQDPNFFIRLMKTREDRFTGRVVPEYGNWITEPISNSPGAYFIVLREIDGLIRAVGANMTTSTYKIRKIQPGYFLRILTGNNVGTYIVSSITPSNTGPHTITLSNVIVNNLPVSLYNPTIRTIYFQGGVDLSTVKVGDIYTDASSVTFNILTIDPDDGTIVIDGTATPSLLANSNISRMGNVFTNTDLSPIRYLVLDPTQPIQVAGFFKLETQKMDSLGVSPPVPIDAYYLIRIDSKTRENHIDVLNRVWEEFNPPRTALPVVQRTSFSAEQLLTASIMTGGSNLVSVKDTSKFIVGDKVFIIDQLHPTIRHDGEGFERPFQSIVTGIPSSTQLQLQDVVPDTYVLGNSPKIISNCEFHLFMFHFVDHVTKDVEGSQYWVHEFTFWVQVWIDRIGTPEEITAITQIAAPIEDIQGNVIIEDN